MILNSFFFSMGFFFPLPGFRRAMQGCKHSTTAAFLKLRENIWKPPYLWFLPDVDFERRKSTMFFQNFNMGEL